MAFVFYILNVGDNVVMNVGVCKRFVLYVSPFAFSVACLLLPVVRPTLKPPEDVQDHVIIAISGLFFSWPDVSLAIIMTATSCSVQGTVSAERVLIKLVND